MLALPLGFALLFARPLDFPPMISRSDEGQTDSLIYVSKILSDFEYLSTLFSPLPPLPLLSSLSKTTMARQLIPAVAVAALQLCFMKAAQ